LLSRSLRASHDVGALWAASAAVGALYRSVAVEIPLSLGALDAQRHAYEHAASEVAGGAASAA